MKVANAPELPQDQAGTHRASSLSRPAPLTSFTGFSQGHPLSNAWGLTQLVRPGLNPPAHSDPHILSPYLLGLMPGSLFVP